MSISILMITSEWPTKDNPNSGKFVYNQFKDLIDINVNVTIFPFRGGKKIINYFHVIIKAFQLSRSTKFSLVHCQFGQSAIIGLFTGLPMVVTYRGTDLNGFLDKKGKEPIRSKALRFLSRLLAKKASQVLVVSDQLGKKLPKEVEYMVLPSGVDFSQFFPMNKSDCRKDLNIPYDTKVVFFPSDPKRPEKDFKLAEEAFNLFKLDFPNAMLFCGGNIPFNEMNIYYNASDVVLFTSKREGSPNVVKEALACNVPVVSTDVGDITTYCLPPECMKIADRDPQLIAIFLSNVFENEGRPECRSHIEYLDNKLSAKKLEEIYRSVALSKD